MYVIRDSNGKIFLDVANPWRDPRFPRSLEKQFTEREIWSIFRVPFDIPGDNRLRKNIDSILGSDADLPED